MYTITTRPYIHTLCGLDFKNGMLGLMKTLLGACVDHKFFFNVYNYINSQKNSNI